MTDVAGHVRQAGCVAIGQRGILIEGPPGSGKSSLALALIDRGAQLVGDDGVVLTVHGDQLRASPHPATAGLLEVRNLGILPFAAVSDIRVCLLLRLDSDAPRFIDAAPTEWLCGIAIPMLRLWPDTAMLALRAELALQHYGLR